MIRKWLRATFPRSMHRYELSHKCWIEVEESLLPAVVDSERDAVDVGAYVGRYTVALARLARTVHAFEPELELATMLQRATPSNVRVCRDAVADRISAAEFHVPITNERRNVTNGSLVTAHEKEFVETRTIQTVTLDAALAGSDVGFVKIDVEGAEMPVLCGARQLITRCRPVVLVEIVGPDEVAAVSVYFAELGYAGFFARDGKTFGLDEFRADMQDWRLHTGPEPRRHKRFVSNFFFAPSESVRRLREEAGKLLASEHQRAGSLRSSPSEAMSFADAARALVRRSHYLFDVLEPLNARVAIARWRRHGASIPAPALVKRDILRRTAHEHGLRVLIETGTFRGDTAMALRRDLDRIVSVELSPQLHARALRRARGASNVELVQGNSAEVLPGILATLSEPALFWLDAHYSGGVTALGDKISPISAELDAVLGHPVRRHVVLIDDARNFHNYDRSGYPSAQTVVDAAHRHDYVMSEKNDIFYLMPSRCT